MWLLSFLWNLRICKTACEAVQTARIEITDRNKKHRLEWEEAPHETCKTLKFSGKVKGVVTNRWIQKNSWLPTKKVLLFIQLLLLQLSGHHVPYCEDSTGQYDCNYFKWNEV